MRIKIIISLFIFLSPALIFAEQTSIKQKSKYFIDEKVFTSRKKLVIHNITPNTQKLPQFEMFELTLDLSATYNNPFDPDDIDVIGYFISLSGKQYTIPGFFYQDYLRDSVGTTERLTLAGKPYFKVRFAPNEQGKWQFFVTVRDRTGQIKSDMQSFEVTKSENRGFLHASSQNNYLVFDSGMPYFAVGESIGWANRNKQTYDYDYFFGKLSQINANYTRIWIVPWHLALEWTNKGWPKGKFFGLGKYCLENAWRMDYILRLAESKGIYIMFTLGNYGELVREESTWNENMWDNNPYNVANGGPAKEPWDFFSNPKAKDYYKKRLRYIIARWGYSANILSFELFNEIDAPSDWVLEMAKFIKQTDPNKHMVTISFGYPDWHIKHAEEEKILQLPEIDYTQLHVWGKADKSQDLIEDLISRLRGNLAKYKKPCLVAEFGINSGKDDKTYDPKGLGVNLHNGLWAVLMSGSFSGAVNWWWDSYVEPKNLYYHHRALANFVSTIDWLKNWEIASTQLSQELLDKVRVLGLTSNDEAIIWIQNRQSNWFSSDPQPIEKISFTVLGLSEGKYTLQWWDTWQGRVIQETQASVVNGKLVVELDSLKRDLALKIKG